MEIINDQSREIKSTNPVKLVTWRISIQFSSRFSDIKEKSIRIENHSGLFHTAVQMWNGRIGLADKQFGVAPAEYL